MPKTRHYRSDNLQLPRHLSREEVQSAVAKYFCRGFMPAEIAKRAFGIGVDETASRTTPRNNPVGPVVQFGNRNEAMRVCQLDELVAA